MDTSLEPWLQDQELSHEPWTQVLSHGVRAKIKSFLTSHGAACPRHSSRYFSSGNVASSRQFSSLSTPFPGPTPDL
eukprot:g17117.t1